MLTEKAPSAADLGYAHGVRCGGPDSRREFCVCFAVKLAPHALSTASITGFAAPAFAAPSPVAAQVRFNAPLIMLEGEVAEASTVAATAGLDGVVVPTGAATRRAEEAEEAHAQATAAAAEGLRVRCLALVDEGDAIIARRTAIAAQEVVVMSRIRTAARRQEEEAEEEATRLAAVASAAEAEAEVPDEYIAMYMSPGTSLTAAEWALSMPDDPSPAVSMPAIEMPMEIANAEVNVLAAPGADSAMSAPAAQSVSIPGGWALSIPAESPTAIESPPPEVSVLAAPVAAPDVDSMLCSDGVEGAERADSRARRPRESRRQAKERQRRSEMVGKVVPAPARGKSKKQRRAAMIGGDLLSSKSRACD